MHAWSKLVVTNDVLFRARFVLVLSALKQIREQGEVHGASST